MARVLIVDDEESVRRPLQRFLQRDGHKVWVCPDGESALERLAAEEFHIILIDIVLPRITGIQLLGKVKEISEDILPIIITGKPSMNTAVEAVRTGAFDYLIKPVSRDMVLKAVSNAVRVKELRDEKKRLEADNLRHQDHLEQLVEERTLELRQSEERFRMFFQNVPVGLYRTTPEGELLDANPALMNMMGFPEGKPLPKNVLNWYQEPGDRARWQRLMEKNDVIRDFKIQLKRVDGTPIWMSMTAQLFRDGSGTPRYYEGSMEDITERKRAEMRMLQQLMKFQVEEGRVYLALEPSPSVSLVAFRELLGVGYRGLVISRTPESELPQSLRENVSHIWLADKAAFAGRGVPVNREFLERRIGRLHRGSVVFVERLDYLVQKLGFPETLELVQHLREICYLREVIAILSLDPGTLKKQESRLLGKECRELEPWHRLPLDDELFDLLKFIYQKNLVGVKPSYGLIHRELALSKPTVRTRLRRLQEAGYVKELSRGASKLLEITELGLSLLVK